MSCLRNVYEMLKREKSRKSFLLHYASVVIMMPNVSLSAILKIVPAIENEFLFLVIGDYTSYYKRFHIVQPEAISL